MKRTMYNGLFATVIGLALSSTSKAEKIGIGNDGTKLNNMLTSSDVGDHKYKAEAQAAVYQDSTRRPHNSTGSGSNQKGRTTTKSKTTTRRTTTSNGNSSTGRSSSTNSKASGQSGQI